MASVIHVFPRRPLKLAPDPKRRKRRLSILLLAALLAAYPLYWSFGLWQESRLRADLRDHGARAADTRQTGGSCMSRRSRLSGAERPIGCTLEISYDVRDEHGGGTRDASLRLEGREPIFTPTAIYDPADPSRVMLAPEVERDATWSERIGPIALLLPALITLLVFFLTTRRKLAKAASSPEPVAVAIEKVIRQPAKLYLHTRAPGDARVVVSSFPNPEQPLIVPTPAGAPADQQWVLALRTPDGRHFVLDSALAWLDMSDEERRALLAAARGY
jgi:hypothetical protein